MRLLLRVLVVLVVLGGMLLLASELLLKPFAERAVGNQIRDEHGLSRSPEVELSGFPFLLSVARGHFDGASVSLDGHVVDGLRLRHAAMDLEGVEFSPGGVIGGNAEVEAETATITADVTESDLNSWLATRELPVTVRFDGGDVRVAGRLEVEGVGGEVEAVGTVTVDGGELGFAPEELVLGGVAVPRRLVDAARSAVSFAVPLPEVAGVQLTAATVRDGEATLTADVSDYLLVSSA